MPDETPQDRSDSMETDLHQLEDHIDEAKAEHADRRKDVEGSLEKVAGDPEGEEDSLGGDDPVGAAEKNTDAGAEASAKGDDRTDDGDEDDDREAEEVANPT